MDGLKSVFEYVEADVRESLLARTESLGLFKELGPPDMCHLVKIEKGARTASNSKELGSYHFVVGVDTSSSAAVAAYLNSMLYQMPDSSGWFMNSSKSNTVYKISAGTYCCWNFFSNIDVRVEINIPGGVEAYGIDGIHERKIELTQKMWQETYVCSILRALQCDNDTPIFPAVYSQHSPFSNQFYKHLTLQISLRVLNPLPSRSDERRFVDALHTLFTEGWTLAKSSSGTLSPAGVSPSLPSPSSYQGSTLVNNFMAKSFIYYLDSMHRHHVALKMFRGLLNVDYEIASLLAPALSACGQEQEAIKCWYDVQIQNPLKSFPLLYSQSLFLWKRKRNVFMALELCRMTVEIAPSNSDAWLLLAELFVANKDYKNALLALNNCPVLLAPQESIVYHPNEPVKVNSVFGNLIELLRIMPSPFHKHAPINDNSNIPNSLSEEVTSFIAESTGGMASNANVNATLTPDMLLNDPLTYFGGSVRHRDACDVSLYQLKSPFLKPRVRDVYSILAIMAKDIGWDTLLKMRSETFVMEEEYKAARGRAVDDKGKLPESAGSKKSKPWNNNNDLNMSLLDRSKRVCERWFDSLFIVLYEDLKVYTVFKTEMDQANSLGSAYERTALEWELLGDLCVRLNRSEDAKECYDTFLNLRFNLHVHYKTLRIIIKDLRSPEFISDSALIKSALLSCEAIVSVLDRWKWGEAVSPCSPTCIAINELIVRHGNIQVKSVLETLNLSKRGEKLISKIIDWCAECIMKD